MLCSFGALSHSKRTCPLQASASNAGGGRGSFSDELECAANMTARRSGVVVLCGLRWY